MDYLFIACNQIRMHDALPIFDESKNLLVKLIIQLDGAFPVVIKELLLGIIILDISVQMTKDAI